jgi:CubicO group peptidase (beta-lactamase class C family)
MRRWLAILATVFVLLAVLAVARLQPGVAMRVGAGYAARVACALYFHSGMATDVVMRDYVAFDLGAAAPLVSARVDHERRGVDASAGGLVRARAIHRDGVGCTLLAEADEAALRRFRDPPHRAALPSDVPWPGGEGPLEAPTPPALAAAVEAAFAEPEGRPGRMRQTSAVLVAHRGRLVAERYAPGISQSTPLLSWSMAKSVTAALVGVAVHEGRIDPKAPARVPEWRGPDDPRGAITIDQLLRMSSGLRFDETYGAVNDVSRMLFTQRDIGAFAAAFPLDHAPDTHWSYSSGTSNIIARLLRDLFEGDLEAMVAWSRTALFDPAGMRTAVFEVDASGSFVGSSLVFASGRDWARFGQLHLQDGLVAGQRLLPEGWSRYVSTPTPAAPDGGYGAGWWLNAGDPERPAHRTWPSLPRDAYAARGKSGQYVVVVPSAELVVVRLGLTQGEDDALHGIEPLVRAAIETLADRG